jgi:hypothetical protein
LHGARQEVIECRIPFTASRFTNFNVPPGRIVGGRRRLPTRSRSPRPYRKPLIATVRLGGGGADSSRRGSARPENAPPWLRFSGRWPCVSTPGRSVSTTNGSGPLPPALNMTGMIPIDSYHEARMASYVAETSSTSPRLTPTRQSCGVASIATSHDTAPAGS